MPFRRSPRSLWRPRRSALAVAAATAVATAASLLVIGMPSASAHGREHGPQPPPGQPVRTCAGLADLDLPRTTVTGAVEDAGDATTPASCRVTLTVADPTDSGTVTVWVYLPTKSWNGRFQGVGGGGFSGGDPSGLVAPLRAGYAAAATDTGHEGSGADFALSPDGSLNWPAIEDYGYEGVQDMTVTAKAVIAAYYGRAPAYSYFNGCSTGGRQGIMEAQRFPDEYDGILAGSPVINFPRMQTGQLWGQLVMLEEHDFVPACKFAAANEAMIAACDTVGDGVVDGVIGDPLACDFDLDSLIGTRTDCGVITATDVAVMRRIGEGPRRPDGGFLWYGLAPGAPFAGLNDTVRLDNGQWAGRPFVFDIWWFRYFLTQNPGFDWTTLTYESFAQWFDVAVQRYGDVLGAGDPDLSAYRKAGGKLIMWHGAADFGVPYQGSLDYYERVAATLGPGHTLQFLRLFVAPGVGHCGGGAGAAPADPFSALVAWVEHGRAPHVLAGTHVDQAGKVTGIRPICMYPFVARWTGRGDPADGNTYRCVPASRLIPQQA